MIYARDVELLRRILDATREGLIIWREEQDGWFAADVGGCRLLFRHLYYEATNQIGADPLAIELSMPGRNAAFFAGTEGYALFEEILGMAFDKWRTTGDPSDALRRLEKGLLEAKGSSSPDSPNRDIQP